MPDESNENVAFPFLMDGTCAFVGHFVNNHILSAVLVFKLAVLPLGFVLYALFVKVQGWSMCCHRNINILIVSSHTCTLIFTVAAFATTLDEMLRFSVPHAANFCEYTVSIGRNMPIMLPNNFAYTGLLISLACMCVERFVASWNFQKYERWGAKLGIALLIVLIVATTGCTYMNFVRPYLGITSNSTLRTLVISKLNLYTLAMTNYTLAGLTTVTLIIFHILLWYNRRSRDINRDVSSKYQMAENIKTIELLLPMVWTHYICFLPSLVNILLPTLNGFNPELNWYTAYVYEICDTVVLYPLILPIVLFASNPVLRSNFVQLIKCRKSRVNLNSRVVHGHATTVDHLKALEDMWNVALTKK